MSRWRIDPEGLRRVLKATEAEQSKLGQALEREDFEALGSGLSWGGEVTAVVPSALAGLLEDQSRDLKNVVFTVAAGIAGTGNAAIALAQGQDEMAGRFQQEMFNSAQSGDFSFFKKYGYDGD